MVKIGLTFTLLGLYLVTVKLWKVFSGAMFLCVVSLFLTMIRVVVLLDSREVPLVAMNSLLFPIGPSEVSFLSAADGWPYLLRLKAILLRWILLAVPLTIVCAILTGTTLLVNSFVRRVTVTCRRECRVHLLRVLWSMLQWVVMPLVALTTGRQRLGPRLLT